LDESKKKEFQAVWNKYCEIQKFDKVLNTIVQENGIGRENYIRELKESEQRRL